MILDPNIASGFFLISFGTQFLELNLKDSLENQLTLSLFDKDGLITILLLIKSQEKKAQFEIEHEKQHVNCT